MSASTETPEADLSPPPGFDTTRRFVRVSGERPNGLVEFDFAVGEPELFVEMILSREAFEEFCTGNEVQMLPPREGVEGEIGDWDWRMSDATHTRFR
ncbi:phenol hydroxylase subunit [Pseudothauera rhizosphaerae]|uniref:Phenol hydroxylase n=1 Tax=Pseudothauera rhizosphaerae TaxID=2565932 RepID=A0A4S4A9C9_9RHOO|nr:phenol hydroxylase subunit [Pseudothauera rhizosphaerae]THF55179.1 phenol hydroxylase [Pseudothauera rhizosphaerae]